MEDFLTRMENRRANAERQQAIANHDAWLRNERCAEVDWHNFNAWLEAKAKEET